MSEFGICISPTTSISFPASFPIALPHSAWAKNVQTYSQYLNAPYVFMTCSQVKTKCEFICMINGPSRKCSLLSWILVHLLFITSTALWDFKNDLKMYFFSDYWSCHKLIHDFWKKKQEKIFSIENIEGVISGKSFSKEKKNGFFYANMYIVIFILFHCV